MLKILFSSTGFVFAAPILTFIALIVDLELNDYGFLIVVMSIPCALIIIIKYIIYGKFYICKNNVRHIEE